MSKFTTGETGDWKIDTTLRRVSCPTVCMIRPETSNENIPPQLIAHIPLMSFGEVGISKQEAEANARLIAAAPEMYRLLQNFCYPEEPYDTRKVELSNKVWELLRRIDGEEEITAHEGTE